MDAGSVLIHAPFGRDAQLTAEVLSEARLKPVICDTFDEFCGRIGENGGAGLVVEEALTVDALQELSEILERQPSWSDFPLIVLARGRDSGMVQWLSLNELSSIGHAILLDRPVRTETLISAVQVALRSRRRQFELALNIAERAEAKQRVTAALAVADEANRSKSNFLAAASHDLRQPFQAMRLYQQLLEQYVGNGPARHVLDLLGQSMDSGVELLNALLDVSTLEAGDVRPARSPISASQLVASVAADLSPLAKAKGLRLRWQTSPFMVRSDPVMLKRLLRNLVVNAVRYTDHGGVLIGCRRRGTSVRIEVWDTGIGIPEEKLGLIFEDFVQLGNEERDRSKGIGLGLAIVARMARLLDLPLSVHSRPGHGSVFGVTVPLAGATTRIRHRVRFALANTIG